VRADGRALLAVEQVVDDLEHRLRGRVLLAQRVGLLQRPAGRLGVRHQGLRAADAARGDQSGQAVRAQQRHQLRGVPLALGEQRTQPVVLAPRLAVAGVRMTDDDQRPGAPLGRERLVEGGLVEGVGQPSLGLAEGYPRHLVDLVVDDVVLDGVVAHDPAVPVGHGLHPVAVGIALGSERRAQPDPYPGLLADLADRGDGRRLTPVELALGEGPVAVPRPVHQQHGVLADHDSTGGQHVPDRPGRGRHGG
jgi:hypothetical protein